MVSRGSLPIITHACHLWLVHNTDIGLGNNNKKIKMVREDLGNNNKKIKMVREEFKKNG